MSLASHALVWLVCTLAGGAAFAEAPPGGLRPFRIQSVSGQVVARLPFEQGWRQVKTDTKLATGTLVEVEEGAQIAFDYSKPGPKADGDRVLISINSPTVARFDRDLLRDVKISSQFLEPPEEDLTEAVSVESPIIGRLREAWRKFVASVRSDKGGQSKDKDIEEKHKSGTIDILRPTADGMVAAGNPSSGVRIVWRTVGVQGITYNLKVWPVDAAEPTTPTAQTQESEFVVKPRKFGRYHVSVWTPTGDWQSPIVTFDLVEEGMPGSGSTEAATVSNEITLQIPPDNFTVSDGSLPFYLDCTWRDQHGNTQLITYEVVVRDDTDKISARISTRRQSARLYLPVRGAYSWQVKAVGPGPTLGTRIFRTSAKRFFTLEDNSVASVSHKMLGPRLETMLGSPGRSVLLLERGL